MEVQTRMGYTVKDFIDSNKFPGMKLISDNSGINREIKGARIIAAPDMEKFLVGGELLLTSLMIYEKLDERMMLSHLEELNKIQHIKMNCLKLYCFFAMNIVFQF